MSCFSGSINNNVNKKVSRQFLKIPLHHWNTMKPLSYLLFSLGKRKGFVLANQRHGLDSIANRSLLAYIFVFSSFQSFLVHRLTQ